jgi:hypothetical protein
VDEIHESKEKYSDYFRSLFSGCEGDEITDESFIITTHLISIHLDYNTGS